MQPSAFSSQPTPNSGGVTLTVAMKRGNVYIGKFGDF